MASFYHYSFSFLLFCSLLFPIFSPSIASTTSSRTKALVLPVTKDSATLQYLTHISQRTPLVPVKLTLDLGGQFLWVDCDQDYVSSTYKPAICDSAPCNLAQSKSCSESCFSDRPKPAVIITLAVSSLIIVLLKPAPLVSLAKTLSRFNPPMGLTSGMAGLGRTKIGLPSQFSSAFSFDRKFAICLSSSTTSNGVVFFGAGPYVLNPGIDVSRSLTYTRLFINPVSTAASYFEGEKSSEYFIGVKSIKINNKVVRFNTSLLNIDKNGNGGTKISTVNPYTVLETSIYKAVVGAFVKALAKVPRVAAVAPFGACFDSNHIDVTRVGPAVPSIDLVLQSEDVVWNIYGANSLVQVNENVSCLGFVDGGIEPVTSIVIGGHQLENNLLQFDIANNRLGFSSSLFFMRTTCSNFNFKSNSA
ncbi:hypothetical protein FEM48_Zijuj07G0131200 [Ziziphus jujuba var. spinosa]|uniref:Peptidase A1 domain-containing protein n=1 Tax=Ziziphus jujuba var. spinosa TaxID=714518 RepID=A0A978V4T7_ZIZJJ|nr:hypothetical protein FEM48_Zijuj07G0131200 [Ziziphus jujuba var. spinosa]